VAVNLMTSAPPRANSRTRAAHSAARCRCCAAAGPRRLRGGNR
jgi:hypothetical protein